MGRRQPEALAHRVAGHAVVGAMMGLDVFDCWQVGRYGNVSITRTSTRAGLESEVAACFAATSAAQCWAQQNHTALPERLSEDEARAHLLLQQLGQGAEPRLRQLADQLVEANWSAIQAVAETLLGPRQSISGDEVVEIVLGLQG